MEKEAQGRQAAKLEADQAFLEAHRQEEVRRHQEADAARLRDRLSSLEALAGSLGRDLELSEVLHGPKPEPQP